MKRKYLFSLALFYAFTLLIPSAWAGEAADFSTELKAVILDKKITSLDAKILIDRLVDPTVDEKKAEKSISDLVTLATAKAGFSNDASTKLATLREIIYKGVPAQNQSPFSYDFDNPNGRLAKNKTLHQYLTTRKGNCVNMPILFLVVAEQMGIPVNITTAPRHIFVQFDNPATGKVEHLETTSGAQPQRRVWQRQIMSITDRSIESGMYWQRLDRKKMIVVMAETLLQKLYEDDNQQERLEVAEVMLEVFPQFDVALIHKIEASRILMEREYSSRYPSINHIPADKIERYHQLAKNYVDTERALFDYGWQRAKPNKNVVIPK